MYHRTSIFSALYRLKLCTVILTAVFVSSCLQTGTSINKEAKLQLQIADNFIVANKNDSAISVLKKARPYISASDPSLCTYYYLQICVGSNPDKLNLYADSALAFFNTESRVKQYPDEYFQSLLMKGDACLRAKQYTQALNYFYKAKTVLEKSNCDDGGLDTKMGGIYYAQKNFKLAARFWAESYKKLLLCHEKISSQKLFGMEQGILNNAGFAYEKAGSLDSARYFYLTDLALINKKDSLNLAEKQNIEYARIVAYDNLGGLNLKEGKLAAAEIYLNKCIAIPSADLNGIKIPPLLKLAELYLKSGKSQKTDSLFKKSRALLNLYAKANAESQVKWYKLYAQYLYNQRETTKAYLYQSKYITLRDSVDNSSAELYRLDVERGLSDISQKQQLIDFEQKDKIKLLYLAGVSIFMFLFGIIIYLIYRNLKKTQKNHKTAKLHNQQLQHTLDELELLNKNYIRIMRVMAHDLRNPISGITGLTALLLGDNDFSEENKHMLKLIETTGKHTTEMINEMLKTGLADENAQMIKQPINLTSLLYDSMELLQFRADEKEQKLVFESSDTPIIAEVNQEKIWRVFNNLIVNAIKFSYTNSIIKVGIREKNDHVIIYVADNGIGIPDKNKENIFEIFTSAKRTGTNGEESFGLGLSISKEIIEKHNGKIWFEDNKDGGTIFYVELPNN